MSLRHGLLQGLLIIHFGFFKKPVVVRWKSAEMVACGRNQSTPKGDVTSAGGLGKGRSFGGMHTQGKLIGRNGGKLAGSGQLGPGVFSHTEECAFAFQDGGNEVLCGRAKRDALEML